MSIVTKKGDSGDTGLVGGGGTSKSDIRLHAFGTVDELNALLGAVLASDVLPSTRTQLERLQHLLFHLGADLAAPISVTLEERINPSHVGEVEGWIATLEQSLPPLSHFILPGGSAAAARLHVARTACRRAERWAVALAMRERVNEQALVFLNRAGDYLFLAAREVNRATGGEEVKAAY